MILADVTTNIQFAVDAVAFGSLFAVLALGLALLFSIMGLMNFAYGELIMAGAYTMFFTRGFGWLAMIVITIIVVTALALILEFVAFRPIRRAAPVTLLITSFAVSFALQQLGWMTVGRGPQKGVEPYPWLTRQLDIGGVLISRLAIMTMVVAVLLLVGMSLLLKRTMLGIQLRASTEDFHMAQLVGVKANRVIAAAFGITGLLAGAIALLFILRTGSIDPVVGRGPLLVAFVGAVIGGLGSLVGAAIGGFVLGALINALQATLPFEFASHTLLFAFLAVIAILVFQPEGLVALRFGLIGRLLQRFRKTPEAAEAGV